MGGGSFVTLTLSDRSLSGEWFDPECWSAEMDLLMRRLAYRAGVGRPRYWWTAERGENTDRPHGHVTFYAPALSAQRLRFQEVDWWKYGHVDIGPLEPGGARYQVGYLCDPHKKGQLIKHGKSIRLGETAFRLYCDMVSERAAKWGDAHLPHCAQWSVDHRWYPMDLRFQEIYGAEYGLPFGPRQLSKHDLDLAEVGLSCAQEREWQRYQVGLRREASAELNWRAKARPVVFVDGKRVPL